MKFSQTEGFRILCQCIPIQIPIVIYIIIKNKLKIQGD